MLTAVPTAASFATDARRRSPIRPSILSRRVRDGQCRCGGGHRQVADAALFRGLPALYGSDVLKDPATALQRMGAAIAAFETESEQFHPFSSKYDFWLANQAQLTAQELHGLALFNDPTKGNCAACHPSTSANGVTAAPVHRFQLRQSGRAAQSGYFGQQRHECTQLYADRQRRRRPCLLRPGNLRSFARQRRTEPVRQLRPVQGADAAQHRRHCPLLPQRSLRDAEGSRSASTCAATPTPISGIRRLPDGERHRSSTTCPPCMAANSRSTRPSPEATRATSATSTRREIPYNRPLGGRRRRCRRTRSTT